VLGYDANMPDSIEEAVRSNYGAVAGSGLSSEHDGVRAVAEAFGYSAADLASIPAQANLGLSCGNPLAFASLKTGEVVVDLGSGGGLDVFLAAARVGPTGRAIGIDMTPEMIALAQRNAARGAGGEPYENVEFHLAAIDSLPLADASVDCVISNCVINLAPDKGAVFREIARVLKPGGRLAISDIALKRDIPEELGTDLTAYVGCVAGAIPIVEYERGLRDAGFAPIEILDMGTDLNAYALVENQAGCCSPAMTAPVAELNVIAAPDRPASGTQAAGDSCCPSTSPAVHDSGRLHNRLAELLRKYDVNEYAASVRVFAVKPC
jgi:SAM-dependent methyltransferase